MTDTGAGGVRVIEIERLISEVRCASHCIEFARSGP